MKYLFGLAGLALIGVAVGCTDGQIDSYEPNEEARAYLTANYPTRDQMFRVQQCVTERTGHEFPDLPADFGPAYLTKSRPPDVPKPPNEVYEAHQACVFHLGLEDRFFPPWDHDKLRSSETG